MANSKLGEEPPKIAGDQLGATPNTNGINCNRGRPAFGALWTRTINLRLQALLQLRTHPFLSDYGP